MNPIHELTVEERMAWGECKICGAKHGEKCNGNVGITLGRNVNGEVGDGAHLMRLNNAPFRVELVPVRGGVNDRR